MFNRESLLVAACGISLGNFMWHAVYDQDWMRAFDKSVWMDLACAITYLVLGGR